MANKQICGMQAFEWSQADAMTASAQATQADNLRAELEHPRIASDAAHEARMECLRAQLVRDRLIMQRARRLLSNPGKSNRGLACDLFGVNWNSANKFCLELGIDPDTRSIPDDLYKPE